jgi:S-layer homology domain
MKLSRLVSIAVLSAATVGVAAAQEASSKAGSWPTLKAQPKKINQELLETYGTSNVSYYRMGAAEFTGMDIGVDDWSDTNYSNSDTFRRYGTITSAWFIGSPHLPSGAQLIGIYVNDCVNDDGTLLGSVRSCNYYGDSCTVLAPINTLQGCGSDYVDLSGAGVTIDNGPTGNQIIIRLITTNTDGSDSFAGVTVVYRLQVSPAPAVATFSDVPTNDFGFQYIEALVASGITGGTGPGVYSPNAFVTRRQMAIFLAKALGLHFQ